MTRRASLPGADELFRITAEPAPVQPERIVMPAPSSPSAAPARPAAEVPAEDQSGATDTQTPARPRHEQKVTFYCTDKELTRLEKTRIDLRSDHKLRADRGRIVRAALDELLDDFEKCGSESTLVRLLSTNR